METVAEGSSQAVKIGHAAPNCIDNKGDYTRRHWQRTQCDRQVQTTKLLKLQ